MTPYVILVAAVVAVWWYKNRPSLKTDPKPAKAPVSSRAAYTNYLETVPATSGGNLERTLSGGLAMIRQEIADMKPQHAQPSQTQQLSADDLGLAFAMRVKAESEYEQATALANSYKAHLKATFAAPFAAPQPLPSAGLAPSGQTVPVTA